MALRQQAPLGEQRDGAVPHPLPVDDTTLRGESWVGALHLAGNVWEWTDEPFAPYQVAVEAAPARVDPPRGPDAPEGIMRVLRGGGWHTRVGGEPGEGTPRYHAAYRLTHPGDLKRQAADGARSDGNLVDDIGFRPSITLDARLLHDELAAAGGDVGAIEHPFYMPAGEFRTFDPDGYVLLIGQLGTSG